ncbi:hypothetical protein TSUD_218990 [Trifolium subterraneum]|uniref:RNase H type-1 domain-containing protein n=1 Tax=Trifolium subterraneum TaxID=3900 RepID=A0A2Z6N8R2_TRISU|nr:hypothetical protein TSUD_218990 [Trifolium subterraneum]
MAEINFESLNLDEEEELNFVVGEDTDEQHDLNLCLEGRFVHDRPIRFNSMKACLADVWRPVKGMTVKEATQGLYLFKFFHPLDVEEVLKGGPWTFDSFTLIIVRLKIGVALQDIPLFHVNFWVQIHDVPIGMMLKTVGKGLANYIGEFAEYDKNNNTSFWRKYMRVKVRMDVRSPLKIEKKIKLNGENRCEVKYAMERDDGQRSWSNEIRVKVRRPCGRVGSRWLHEEGKNRDDVDASGHSGERGSHQTGPTQTNVASPRESSRGPENGGIVSTNRGHIPSLRPTVVRHSSSIQGSSIEAPVVALISNRPTLAITNDNVSKQLTETSSLNERNQFDHDDMDIQMERKRRRAEGLVEEGSEVRTHQHFLSAAIDVEGRSGDLAVFWKDSGKCHVLNYTRNFINMIVEDEQWGEWRLTCYYGYPERSRRRSSWDLLRDLGNMSSIPWCIIGDFNDLLSQADKKGIHPHPNGLCMGFRQAVSDCDLTDIPIEGHPFTWIKSRGTPHVIEERLDRAMASTSLLQLFPQNSWLKEPDLEDVVVEGWGGRENLEVVDRVTRCANKLQRWGKKKRVRFKEEIDECVRHATLLIQEEGYWKQRAKMHWLQEGDMNTRFFHMSLIARSKKKKVTKLIADNGTEAHTQEELCEVAKSYFDTLFKPRDGDHDPVLNLIQPRVTNDDNFFLTAPITKIEIRQALFQMHPGKSPGLDGFNPAFYQRFWEQCSDDIFSVASTWLERGYLLTSLNETNICLIPKCDNPTSMKDLRPISLCNVLYKMISKVLANSSVNYSVLMNYDRVCPISPGRGLRQECLTALIHQVVGRGNLHGVRIFRGAPEISHLLFADDCFLFCRANVTELQHAAKEDLSRILGVRLVLGTAFNKAMVAKQVWNIVQNPNSLVAKIIKARYFPHSSLFDAPWGYNPNFAWRSMWHAKQILSLGCRWRIGSGYNRWVPSPQPAGDVAKMILETPLVSSVREDKVVWEEERNGCYSVKSSYNLVMRYIIEDVSRLIIDCWKDEWGVIPIVPCVMRRLRMSFTYSLVRRVEIQLVEWLCYSGAFGTISNSVSGSTEADLVRWEKPALGWVKCNVDIAFVSGSGRTSVGLCFRDNSGQFMAAMEEARYRGLDRVQFESDSKVLIEAIQMKRRGNSEFLSIVHDILSFMSSFLNFEVKFVRRQVNSVAHTLARAANSWTSFHRFEIILLCINT